MIMIITIIPLSHVRKTLRAANRILVVNFLVCALEIVICLVFGFNHYWAEQALL